MKSREERIATEAASLWRELCDEPPPAGADGADLLDLMLRRLPTAGYERLSSPHLRPAGLSFPKTRR
jgi:hypothetical protein